MRIHADPDPQPWLNAVFRIRTGSLIFADLDPDFKNTVPDFKIPDPSVFFALNYPQKFIDTVPILKNKIHNLYNKPSLLLIFIINSFF